MISRSHECRSGGFRDISLLVYIPFHHDEVDGLLDSQARAQRVGPATLREAMLFFARRRLSAPSSPAAVIG